MATFVHHLLEARASSGAGSARGGGSNSASSIVSTLIPVLIISSIIIVVFLILRAKILRVYSPRGQPWIVHNEDKRTPQPGSKPTGLFATFKSLPDEFVLHHNSLDGYLFLRYFKLLIVISLVGLLITWPVLFPVNITGGGGQKQIDRLSFSNVNPGNRYYAQAGVAIVFLGFVMLAIAHERFFFVAIRQAYYMSPMRAQKLSARTILFMNLPEKYQNEASLRELLGSAVRKIWIVTDCDKLDDVVQDRGKAATKLEGAEAKLILNSHKAMLKEQKKGNHEKSTGNGQESSQGKKYLEAQKRPSHRLKFLIGKKVDTVDWARDEIPKLSKDIREQQHQHAQGNAKVVSSAFVEFTNQVAAQRALQLAAPSKKKEFQPRYIGVEPREIVWQNLNKKWAQRKSMLTVATVLVVLLTIFWTPITAFVGALTNINYLTDKVPFLSFINSIPKVILGVITGLLPTIVLAVCLILVPIIMRLLAKIAGEPTLSAIELKTQSWYFIFQVIQVFLVTTFASGASAVTTQIIKNPGSAPALLANNLPKASNFYISYFILYGLMQAALQLACIAPLLTKTLLSKFLDKTPRKQYTRWTSLNGLGWGSEYPKWTNLGVIALSYSCIAPLVLGFSTLGFLFLYIAFRQNWLFVFGNQIDMKGAAYAKALNQLTTGVYLSTVCLIGLFGIGIGQSRYSIGPFVLMIIFLVVVIIFHIFLDRSLKPLEEGIPIDMLEQNESSMFTPTHQQSLEAHHNHNAAPHGHHTTSPISGVGGNTSNGMNDPQQKADWETTQPKTNPLTARIRPIIHNRFYTKLIHSNKADSFTAHHSADEDLLDPNSAYLNPSLSAPNPLIWLPRDNLGISRILILGNEEKGVDSTEEYAWVDDKGKVAWDLNRSEDIDEILRRGDKIRGDRDYATAGNSNITTAGGTAAATS